MFINPKLTPIKYYNFTAASATGLTLTGVVPNPPSYAIIRVEGGDVRYRDDGTDPTSSAGMLLKDLESLEYSGDFSAIKFIAVAGSPTLHVAFYGQRPVI